MKNNEGFAKGSVVQTVAGVVPVGEPLKEMVSDNLMVMGLAARQVHPVHGGGIGWAMDAGKLAAEVAIKALEKGDLSRHALHRYQEAWGKIHGQEQIQILKVRRMLENVSDEDFEYCFENLKMNDMMDFVSGRNLRKMLSLLANRPSLLRLARHLL